MSTPDFSNEEPPAPTGRSARVTRPTPRMQVHNAEQARLAERRARRAPTNPQQQPAPASHANGQQDPSTPTFGRSDDVDTELPPVGRLFEFNFPVPNQAENVAVFSGAMAFGDQHYNANGNDMSGFYQPDHSDHFSAVQSQGGYTDPNTQHFDSDWNMPMNNSGINVGPVAGGAHQSIHDDPDAAQEASAANEQALGQLQSMSDDITSTAVDVPAKKVSRRLALATSAMSTPPRAASHLIRRAHNVTPSFPLPLSPSDKENVPLDATPKSSPAKRTRDNDDPDDGGDNGDNHKPGYRARDLAPGRKRIVELAYIFYRHRMLADGVFGDDTQAETNALYAWYAALDVLAVTHNYVGRPAPTDVEVALIKARGPQHRGKVKTAARQIVNGAYNPVFVFVNPTSLEAVNANRDLVDLLKRKDAFIRRDPWNPTERGSLFRSPLICQVINEVYFNDRSKSEGARTGFFADNEVPFPAIALVTTAIEAAIDEWKTGEMVKSEFTGKKYEARYVAHLKTLNDWDAYTASRSGATQQFQEELYAQGLLHAGINAVATEMADSFSINDFAADE